MYSDHKDCKFPFDGNIASSLDIGRIFDLNLNYSRKMSDELHPAYLNKPFDLMLN